MTVTANISPFWATPMADYVNPQLARELKEYVLTKEAQGIESGVAEFIKHNLTESAFDFFHSDDPVIQKSLEWICECLKATLNSIHGSEENYQIGLMKAGITLHEQMVFMMYTSILTVVGVVYFIWIQVTAKMVGHRL